MKNIKGLRIDYDSGEGEIILPDEFKNENSLFRADVLHDWLYDIAKLYLSSLNDWHEDLNLIKKEGKNAPNIKANLPENLSPKQLVHETLEQLGN